MAGRLRQSGVVRGRIGRRRRSLRPWRIDAKGRVHHRLRDGPSLHRSHRRRDREHIARNRRRAENAGTAASIRGPLSWVAVGTTAAHIRTRGRAPHAQPERDVHEVAGHGVVGQAEN